MGRFLHLLLLIFSTHLGSAFAQESPIFYLTAQTQELYLKNFQIFLDSRGHFLPQKSASEFPDDNSAMWVRFDLQALENAPREWWLELNMPLVDDVILQTVNADGVIFSQQHFNYLDFPRAVDYRNAVFKLNLPQNARQTFYLKVQTQTSMPGSLHLWKPEVFQQKIKKDTLNYGIIIGLWIANLLILFFFSLISKNKIAALYFYLFAFYVFMLLSIFGYLQWLFLPQLTQYQILLSGIGILGAGAFSLYLSFYFLEIDKRLPFRRLSHHFLIFATLLYLCCFIALCIPEYHLIGRRVVQLFILLQLVLFTNVGFWITWRYRSVSAFIFTIGMLQPFLNSALYVLQNFGISLFTHFLNDSFYITVSVIANICLVDLGLFVFYADLNKKNQQTKQALQVVQQRITYEKQINEERFEFLRSLSHELRTPATLINMAVQNLRFLFAAAKPPDEDFLVTRLERIYNASERLNALLEENMSRYQFAFDSTEMDIKIHNTQDLIALIMEDLKKAELSPMKLKTQKLPVEIACDLALIRVSVRNLVQNAFKHSQRNELVQLEFKGLLRGGLRISVKDNGSGISKQHLPFIFDKFYRAQAQQQGSGLGLYLVKHIVTLHHGRIRAFSMQGRGTQIVIFLPAGKLKNFKR